MNTIFWQHVGQRGKIGGTQLEDTPTAGMSAPPLVPVCWCCPITTGWRKKSFGSGRGFFKLKLGHCEIQVGHKGLKQASAPHAMGRDRARRSIQERGGLAGTS